MATIQYDEQFVIEDYLDMGGGYVLDFSDATFREFIFENLHIDIDNPKYFKNGSSKAKRLRTFLKAESDYIVAQLLSAFVKYYDARRKRSPTYFKADSELTANLLKIIERLKIGGVSPHLGNITPINEEEDFRKLCESIRESIEKNAPEMALDRVHTFYVKFIRGLCDKNEIAYLKEDSLNAIFGKYVKFVEKAYPFESDMSLLIMKYSISLFEKFNDIRNNKSLAHDNKLLNYYESLYVFDTLARLKGFIDFIQGEIDRSQEAAKSLVVTVPLAFEMDDLPF